MVQEDFVSTPKATETERVKTRIQDSCNSGFLLYYISCENDLKVMARIFKLVLKIVSNYLFNKDKLKYFFVSYILLRTQKQNKENKNSFDIKKFIINYKIHDIYHIIYIIHIICIRIAREENIIAA